jgi:hypothetical protein
LCLKGPKTTLHHFNAPGVSPATLSVPFAPLLIELMGRLFEKAGLTSRSMVEPQAMDLKVQCLSQRESFFILTFDFYILE